MSSTPPETPTPKEQFHCGVCTTVLVRDARPKWPLFHAVTYLQGRGIHYGSGEGKLLDRRANAPGVYCVGVDSRKGGDTDIVGGDFTDLADSRWNYVVLQPTGQDSGALSSLVRQARKKLSPRGHLILLGRPDVVESLRTSAASCGAWQAKDDVTNDGLRLAVLKLAGTKRGITPAVAPSGRRVCISRYGAFGDLIQITPLIRRLHSDGYHVTLNLSAHTASILQGNPFVANTVLQERDAIWNPDLSQYWAYWSPKYDRYINLSESIEGDLLKIEGKRDFYSPTSWRHEQFGAVNYIEHTMRLAGYEDGKCGPMELYFTDLEHKRCRKWREDARKAGIERLVMWHLKGSSYHKQYPLAEQTAIDWLEKRPECGIVLTGAEEAVELDFAGTHPRVVSLVNQWPVRYVACLTQYVDAVIGPETGMLSAAACYDTPKIVLLSHSSPINIAKHWTNTQCLMPGLEYAPCYGESGCHQLHYNLPSCPLTELYRAADEEAGIPEARATVPACTVAITPERIWAALEAAVPPR